MRDTIDGTDETLLALLADDSRAPLKTLGAAVGLSTSAVQERVARLRRQGHISAFTIRRGRRNGTVTAYLWVTTETPMCEQLAPEVARFPEATVCDSIAGEIDMVVTLEARDHGRVHEIRDRIASLDGVREVRTAIVLSRRLDRTGT